MSILENKAFWIGILSIAGISTIYLSSVLFVIDYTNKAAFVLNLSQIIAVLTLIIIGLYTYRKIKLSCFLAAF